MSAVEADKAMFAKALKALGPYLVELVVIGGWAHRLCGLHPMARAPEFQPLTTEDADIAAPVRLQKKGESIAALLKREGFAKASKGPQAPRSRLHPARETPAAVGPKSASFRSNLGLGCTSDLLRRRAVCHQSAVELLPYR